MDRRILIMGGTGVFGKRLARHLATFGGIELFISSRTAAKAQVFVQSLKAKAPDLKAQGVAIDHRENLDAQLAAIKPFAVIDCSGPFQTANYDAAQTTLKAGAHLIDLADARDYLANFVHELDALARANNVAALTGASSTPTLSSCVVAHVTRDWQRIDSIDICIVPGGKSEVGRSVIEAILSYAGKLVPIWIDGHLTQTTGWTGAKTVNIGVVHDAFLLSSRDAYVFRDRENRLDTGDTVVLIGDLSYAPPGMDDRRALPGARVEIDAVAALVRSLGASVETLTGADATERRLSALAGKASILHLATHGFFTDNMDEPFSLFNAGLLLSRPVTGSPVASEEDNVVYAEELMRWDLNRTKLVVVSACLSGVGEASAIDAVRGLPIALAHAGARRSLVTLRLIPDQQTAVLMERFHRYLAEDGKNYDDAFLAVKRDVWAGRLGGVEPGVADAFVLYVN